MAVPEQLPIVSYVANGATDHFNITFDLSDERFLVVTVNNEIPQVGAFTVQDKDVVFAVKPEAGTIITLARDTDLERETTYSRYDNSFNPAALNWDLDKLWHVLQEQNLVDAKILARIKSEIEWRRTHDFNYDELAKARDAQIFGGLKEYLDTILAGSNPNIFGGITAGVVFAQDKKSIQTHITEILDGLEKSNTSISAKAETKYVNEQLSLKQQLIDQKASKSLVTAIQQQKADQVYVDNALAGFQSGSFKAYPTLTAANADIGNIALNTKVSVLSATEGGDYYKSSAGATSLTKSAYDPLQQAKNFFLDKTKFYETTNLVNPAQATESGYYLYNLLNKPAPGTGFDNYFSGLDYYPAKSGDYFWMTGVTHVQFCRADKTAIWSMELNNSNVWNGIFTIPYESDSHPLADCAYIRLSTNLGQSAFINKLVALGVGTLLPNPVPEYMEGYSAFRDDTFIAPIFEQYNDKIEEKLSTRSIQFLNIVNPAQETSQGFYSASGVAGKDQAGFEAYYVGLDYYPAKVGDKFWVNNVASMQFCRADKSVIWGTYGSGLNVHIVNGIFTLPNIIASVPVSDCAFIRIGSDKGSAAFIDKIVAMGPGNTKPYATPDYAQEYFEPTPPFVAGLNNVLGAPPTALHGKKWVTLGDSITHADASYATQLATKHGATLVKHTKVGAMIAKPFVANPDVMILSEEYLNIDTVNPPDIITIAAGVNDDNIIGSFSDRTNSTFYGALHVLLVGLRSRFFDTRIGFIAPIPYMKTTENVRYIEGDMSNRPYLKYKAIKEVCAYYGIPVWNGNTEFGASPYDSAAWRTKYMNDGIHPTTDGQIWYANRVENFILGLAK